MEELYTKWQVLSEDEHTKYVYDWQDWCWNVIVRRIEKKENPWCCISYRKSMFKILIHSKSESSEDIDYWFITDFVSDRLRFDFKERRFSKDSEMYIHNMKFYNNKYKLHKNQEELRLKYKLLITNAVLVWAILWQYKELIQKTDHELSFYENATKHIPYEWNEEFFEKIHHLENEKRKYEDRLEELKEKEDLIF